MAEEKPKVIVFGGCGFLGREIVLALVSGNVAAKVLVVDKVPPQMAWLGPRHLTAFKNPTVQFKSANLINPSSVQNVFDQPFDWAINAAGETKPGLSENVYEEGITKLSINCSHAAAKNNVKVYVEVSDGRISSEKGGATETSSAKPWCTAASCKGRVEQQLKEVQGLQWLVVRPALVYGPGDKQGIASNLVMGAVYRHLQEKLKMLWDAGLRVNTVHVEDCARAIVFLCQRGVTQEVFHVVDDADSTQGSLAQIIADIFDIKVDYYGSAASHLAKLDAEGTVADANEKHLPPWAELCAAGSVGNTPLTPYVDSDILKGCHLHLNGEKLRKLGFVYHVQKPTKENLLKIIEEQLQLQMFPKNALPKGVLQS